jgi:hypothetical protein
MKYTTVGQHFIIASTHSISAAFTPQLAGGFLINVFFLERKIQDTLILIFLRGGTRWRWGAQRV